MANQVNVYAPPAGPGKDADSIVAELVKFRDANKVPKGVVIQAYGYDENVMPKGGLLNRDHLDKALPDNPVLVGHVSMHGTVMNSAAMKKWNISAQTKTPPGGVIVRKPGTNEPYGLIMETAYIPIFASLPQPTKEQEVEWSKAGQRLYAQFGVTTAHEGATHLGDLELMKRAAAGGASLIDVIAYPFITDLEKILAKYPKDTWGRYENGLKIGGVKITIDGSPQGKTALFTKPYLTGGPGGEKNWKGELSFPEPLVAKAVKATYDMGVPLNLHANGDGGIDAFLRVHEAVAAGDLGKDRNVTIIHSQFVRKDQLDKYVQYKIRPSLYTLHTYYFAEAHIANRGREQTAYISPMRDAIDKGLVPTNHTDFVVAPLGPDVHDVVGRQPRLARWRGDRRGSARHAAGSAQGHDDQCRAAVWRAGLEGLARGRQARRPGHPGQEPVKVEPMAIKDIKVIETIKDGKTVYTRP